MSFWMNPDIDLTKIVDSMQLESNQVVAELEEEGAKATLEVRGDVKVFWSPIADIEPLDGGMYLQSVSEFPEELKQLIASSSTWWQCEERVYVAESNWFEVFYGTKEYPDSRYDVVDAEGMTVDEVRELLEECLRDVTKDWCK